MTPLSRESSSRSEYPTGHWTVVGQQPHEGCEVCDLLDVLAAITEVDGEGTPIHDQTAMYQMAADALNEKLPL